MTLTLLYEPDLQSHTSYGHDLLTCTSSRSVVTGQLVLKTESKQTAGLTDRQTDGVNCITSFVNEVSNNKQTDEQTKSQMQLNALPMPLATVESLTRHS